MQHIRKTLICITSLLIASAQALQLHGQSRRAFLGGCSTLVIAPAVASAGIDVSGLRVEGSTGNSAIQSQLKAYDGSATSRVREIKAAAVQPPAPTAEKPTTKSSAATYALRYGDFTTLTKLGLGGRYRLQDYVVGPDSNSRVMVSFEFPSDWLQLDKLLGGIEYVDQRNGDKLYLLRTTLPEGTTLATVPKSFFAQSIFDPEGSIVRGGTNVEDYRASKSEILEETRRRLTMKYATVTGNGLRVERRALVDAQQIGQDAYMLVTSSNAVKFEAKGMERDTVEAIVASFVCDKL